MVFKMLLKKFCGFDFCEEEAEEHWYEVYHHQKSLEQALQRPVGFVVAFADYWMNRLKRPNPLFLVDREHYEKTKESAMRDPLTGLYNRAFLRDYLEKEFDKIKRYPLTFSLLFLDVDHFKQFNDKFGHLGGDQILQKIARVLVACSRGSDLVVRYGGEEFVVVIYQTSGKMAYKVADRLRRRIEREVFNIQGVEEAIQVTVSGGLAISPTDAQDADQLLNQADEAMYLAKSRGRNRIYCYRDIQEHYLPSLSFAS